jgi:hypothetical protein
MIPSAAPMDTPSLTLLRDRLGSVEALRGKARSSNVVRIVLYVLLALAALPALLGGVFGSVWFAGNYIAQSVALVAVVFVASTALICWVFYRLAKAVSRIRENAAPTYEDAFHEQAVRPSLREVLPECTVTMARSDDQTAYHGAQLFRDVVGTFEARTLFEGTVCGAPWRGELLMVRASDWVSGRSRPEDRVLKRAFGGVLVHVALPAAPASSIRLIHTTQELNGPVYQLRHFARRRPESGDPSFDETFVYLLSSSDQPVPATPEPLRKALLFAKEQLSHTLLFTANETGLYLAVVAPDPQPFEPVVYTQPNAETLAADLELVRKLPEVAERLTRAMNG